MKSWEIQDTESKFFVRYLPATKTDDMKSCVVPTIKQKLVAIVIHCCTNDLSTEKDHAKISDNILRLAHQCKTW